MAVIRKAKPYKLKTAFEINFLCVCNSEIQEPVQHLRQTFL